MKISVKKELKQHRKNGHVKWSDISKYQKLSEDFIKEFKLKIEDTNWLYVSNEHKMKVLNKFEYEIQGTKIIAYKGIRSDNYSNYNFQYQYFRIERYNCQMICREL